jgi:hypothetical protein
MRKDFTHPNIQHKERTSHIPTHNTKKGLHTSKHTTQRKGFTHPNIQHKERTSHIPTLNTKKGLHTSQHTTQRKSKKDNALNKTNYKVSPPPQSLCDYKDFLVVE